MRALLIRSTALALFAAQAFAADMAPLTAPLSSAPAGAYKLEKSHASITFKLMHMGLAAYTARFNDFDAAIKLNPTAPEKSTLTVTIRPASYDSNNPKMTQHASNADFFNVEKYPTITFVSTSIEKTGEKTGIIKGDLTMLGVTKPVAIDATFNGGGVHPYFKQYTVGFSGKTTITRSDFGMNFGVPMVSDTVEVAIETEFLQDIPAKKSE